MGSEGYLCVCLQCTHQGTLSYHVLSNIHRIRERQRIQSDADGNKQKTQGRAGDGFCTVTVLCCTVLCIVCMLSMIHSIHTHTHTQTASGRSRAACTHPGPGTSVRARVGEKRRRREGKGREDGMGWMDVPERGVGVGRRNGRGRGWEWEAQENGRGRTGYGWYVYWYVREYLLRTEGMRCGVLAGGIGPALRARPRPGAPRGEKGAFAAGAAVRLGLPFVGGHWNAGVAGHSRGSLMRK